LRWIATKRRAVFRTSGWTWLDERWRDRDVRIDSKREYDRMEGMREGLVRRLQYGRAERMAWLIAKCRVKRLSLSERPRARASEWKRAN